MDLLLVLFYMQNSHFKKPHFSFSQELILSSDLVDSGSTEEIRGQKRWENINTASYYFDLSSEGQTLCDVCTLNYTAKNQACESKQKCSNSLSHRKFRLSIHFFLSIKLMRVKVNGNRKPSVNSTPASFHGANVVTVICNVKRQ